MTDRLTDRFAHPPFSTVLPHPHGGSVLAAERALTDARYALARQQDPGVALARAAEVLREAGWLAGHRFASVLLQASRLIQAQGAQEAPERGMRVLLCRALDDFRALIDRHDLRETASSPTLFAHYVQLGAALPPTQAGFVLDDLALAGRPVPPVTHGLQPAHRLAHLRARYERALLPVLRAAPAPALSSDTDTDAAASFDVSDVAAREAACDTLDACLEALRGYGPYDFWQLAASCAQVLRASACASRDAALRRFYARCNLALADCARADWQPPRAWVRGMLALIWCEYAWFGAAASEDGQSEQAGQHIGLLLDYGLTVPAFQALGAATATAGLSDFGGRLDAARSPEGEPPVTRTLGVLTVTLRAYEDFLQTADAAMAVLADYAHRARDGAPVHPSAAFQASVAAARLGAAAGVLGLGHIALLADALGLAWRMQAHEAAGAFRRRGRLPSGASPADDVRVLGLALEKLHAMLHKVAAGVAPPEGGTAFAALVRWLEQAD
ncbi:hypothetical protein [Paraburkholderia hayleyella]|uniref:hypothetical protein n=1 Tax=Paraburkholderia hayleyella TaxID=2152889 RepID=UPI001FE82EA0|nr:hypothetical protein [Paraburkholderia hayleyella]